MVNSGIERPTFIAEAGVVNGDMEGYQTVLVQSTAEDRVDV